MTRHKQTEGQSLSVSKQSQIRAGYRDELGKDWPVVNTYPEHIQKDPHG